MEKLQAQLAAYRNQLAQLRQSWPTAYDLPDVPFFLFGMGQRGKLIYQNGVLRDARSGKILDCWEVRQEIIVPPAYTVWLETGNGPVEIREDEQNIWLNGTPLASLNNTPIHLPTFQPATYNLILRVLHHDILINLVDGRPTPNFFVYPKPWYRDSAMMAMVLQKTDNLHLLRDWILSLDDPFDHNNAGECEADNLGQVLYLLALVADASHPLAQKVLALLPQFTQGKTLTGRTDFGIRPVYQTKWIKFGLRSLGLADPYEIPAQFEDYSALFWWDTQPQHIPGKRMISSDYPYLTWAGDTRYQESNGPVGNRDYPLTWETNASQADYDGMAGLSPEYTRRRIAAPHTWHAAEMFFRLQRA